MTAPAGPGAIPIPGRLVHEPVGFLAEAPHPEPAAALEGLHQADLDAPGRMTSMLPAGVNIVEGLQVPVAPVIVSLAAPCGSATGPAPAAPVRR